MIPLPHLTDDLTSIRGALDDGNHEQRMAWMRGLGKRDLQALYDLSASGEGLTVSHFHGETGAVVIHHGQNSLPAFNAFQKRVVSREGGVQGYNHQAMAWLTGPGHFVLRQEEEEVIFDYTVMPESSIPEFPPLRPNEAGLSRFVYGNMIDRVRRVSKHCTIGIAIRHGKITGDVFMLTREHPED